MDTPTPRLPSVSPTFARATAGKPVQFIKEVVSELKKVDWPRREETIKLTVVVLVISVAVAAFIGGLDWAMINLTSAVFKR